MWVATFLGLGKDVRSLIYAHLDPLDLFSLHLVCRVTKEELPVFLFRAPDWSAFCADISAKPPAWIVWFRDGLSAAERLALAQKCCIDYPYFHEAAFCAMLPALLGDGERLAKCLKKLLTEPFVCSTSVAPLKRVRVFLSIVASDHHWLYNRNPWVDNAIYSARSYGLDTVVHKLDEEYGAPNRLSMWWRKDDRYQVCEWGHGVQHVETDFWTSTIYCRRHFYKIQSFHCSRWSPLPCACVASFGMLHEVKDENELRFAREQSDSKEF
jgi:hypothetical protein